MLGVNSNMSGDVFCCGSPPIPGTPDLTEIDLGIIFSNWPTERLNYPPTNQPPNLNQHQSTNPWIATFAPIKNSRPWRTTPELPQENFKALTTFLLIGTEALTFLLSSILVPPLDVEENMATIVKLLLALLLRHSKPKFGRFGNHFMSKCGILVIVQQKTIMSNVLL